MKLLVSCALLATAIHAFPLGAPVENYPGALYARPPSPYYAPSYGYGPAPYAPMEYYGAYGYPMYFDGRGFKSGGFWGGLVDKLKNVGHKFHEKISGGFWGGLVDKLKNVGHKFHDKIVKFTNWSKNKADKFFGKTGASEQPAVAQPVEQPAEEPEEQPAEEPAEEQSFKSGHYEPLGEDYNPDDYPLFGSELASPYDYQRGFKSGDGGAFARLGNKMEGYLRKGVDNMANRAENFLNVVFPPRP
uniref:DUF148 domain-containing protein n=1 Tax=Steinernema glaseri TaxID=37863 RepID=A0A1I7XVL3_9BILA